jgi:energy-coupling factor transport system permease protein
MTGLVATIPFYRRLASPLHATRASIGATWTLALLLAVLLCDSPIVLGTLLVAVLVAAAGAGVFGPLTRALRGALIVAAPVVVVNVLVSRGGLTVFARLGDLGPFGQGDLTVEALAYGGLIALKLTLVILVVALGGLAVDPDELLRAVRRLSFRSALTTSIAMRMLPLLAADAQRLAQAQRTRPDSPATADRRSAGRSAGRSASVRGRLAILGAVVGGSLDRAMDVAATLELRGFASARRAPRRARAKRALSRHDIAFAASAIAVAALAVAARAAGDAGFSAYPTVHMPLGAGTVAVAVAIAAAALAPFASRRGIDP